MRGSLTRLITIFTGQTTESTWRHTFPSVATVAVLVDFSDVAWWRGSALASIRGVLSAGRKRAWPLAAAWPAISETLPKICYPHQARSAESPSG
jgi:hypothetical protein